jgi:hypothetical protein
LLKSVAIEARIPGLQSGDKNATLVKHQTAIARCLSSHQDQSRAHKPAAPGTYLPTPWPVASSELQASRGQPMEADEIMQMTF